jgi:hypothetical protein
MTLRRSLSELDAELDTESESERELSRVTVLVGGMMLDVGLPAHLSIAATINDVIDLANTQLATCTELREVVFDDSEGRWTFSRLGGDPIDPNRSLAEAGIYDGDVLAVTEIGPPAAPLLFDDVEGPVEPGPRTLRGWLVENNGLVGWFGLGLAAAMAAPC